MTANQTHTPTDLSFNGLSALYRIARLLSAEGNLEGKMADVLQVLDEDAGMGRGMISILKAGEEELAVDVAHGVSSKEKKRGTYRLGEGVTGKVVESGKPAVIRKLSEEPTFLDRTGARKQLSWDDLSFLCVPITAGDDVVGALSVDRVGTDKESTLDSELEFLKAVSDLIAQVVVARRKQNERLEELEQENRELRRNLEEKGKPDEMIGNSRSMKNVYRQIAQVAPSPTTVLICGETGTGKELVARAIHDKSPRAHGPFVPVNCAALPESLLESELFGHEKGSFTGATSMRAGRFESAHAGTIFLDEIGEMSPSAQARLLRAIQEKQIQRVGGTETISIDVRVIAATNRNLEEDVSRNRFREDLYYRINVFTVYLPPLRERGADVLLLADYFSRRYAGRHGKEIARISTPAIDMLAAYHWPGNVRELENVIERAVLVSENNVLNGHDLPPTLQMKDASLRGLRDGSFESLVASYEKELITDALKDARGNQTEAAKLLRTTKRVIQYKVSKYGIEYKRFQH
ncbi:MAG: GAF domain-containing protein [Chitinivibrionales bacterium]|nr:GAF domain-containing protein [Chitinivibrionales bacterium]MBD3397008.1 GAF domain-containing protein [Chitinivibrionales bacterium]